MEAVKVFLIRNAKGDFLQQNSTPRIGVYFSDIEHAWFFPTESQAQGFIASCCKQNNTAKIIDCMVIEGEFTPKEGYKAIDEVLKSKRMKALYNLMKAELSVAELLLFTAASDRVEACKHPFFTKLKAAKLGQGFDSIDATKESGGRYWRDMDAAEKSFDIFKRLAFVAMKDKAKEQL
jgi:hypothetical protein